MSVITKMRREKAVWWARSTKDRYGRWTFSAPVEVDCRWDDTTQEFIDPQGEEQASRAVVYVDREMTPGDRLARGAMDSTTPDDPLTVTTSFEIRRFDKNPNFKATEYLLTAFL